MRTFDRVLYIVLILVVVGFGLVQGFTSYRILNKNEKDKLSCQDSVQRLSERLRLYDQAVKAPKQDTIRKMSEKIIERIVEKQSDNEKEYTNRLAKPLIDSALTRAIDDYHKQFHQARYEPEVE